MRKLPHTAAEDLLELIMRRYERASTLLTSKTIDDIRAPSTLNLLADKRIGPPPHADYGSPLSALCRECPFGGLRSNEIPDAEAHVWRAEGCDRLA